MTFRTLVNTLKTVFMLSSSLHNLPIFDENHHKSLLHILVLKLVVFFLIFYIVYMFQIFEIMILGFKI